MADVSDVDANTRRGQLLGTHCAACGTEFTDEDRPTYTGPFAAIAATGLTMTCRVCREYADACRANGTKPDASRLGISSRSSLWRERATRRQRAGDLT